MIVDDVLGHGPLEVPLAQGNDAIETFMFDRADEALGVGIRIRREPRRLHNSNATITKQPPYLSAPFRVPIANQYAMRAQQSPIRRRQRATDLPHEQLVGMRRRPENVHTS